MPPATTATTACNFTADLGIVSRSCRNRRAKRFDGSIQGLVTGSIPGELILDKHFGQHDFKLISRTAARSTAARSTTARSLDSVTDRALLIVGSVMLGRLRSLCAGARPLDVRHSVSKNRDVH